MATTVGPTLHNADNSAGTSDAALSDWRAVGRFHDGTSTLMLTQDAGYTTASAFRLATSSIRIWCWGRSPYTKLGIKGLKLFAKKLNSFSSPLISWHRFEPCNFLLKVMFPTNRGFSTRYGSLPCFLA